MRTILVVLAVLSMGCSPRRGGGGGGGEGGDGPGDPVADAGFVVDVAGEDLLTLSAVYVDEVLPQGRWRQVVASPGMTCAAYRTFWADVGPAYAQAAVSGDTEALLATIRDATADLPGMPGWYGQLQIPDGLEAGDALEGEVQANATEYLVEESEAPGVLPFAVGRHALLDAVDVGGLDALGASAEGSVAGTAAWYGDFDPSGPSTSQDRAMSITFDAAHCELDDVEVPDP